MNEKLAPFPHRAPPMRWCRPGSALLLLCRPPAPVYQLTCGISLPSRMDRSAETGQPVRRYRSWSDRRRLHSLLPDTTASHPLSKAAITPRR